MSRVVVTSPYRAGGEIYFTVSEPGQVRIAIFNVHGQKTRDLVDRTYSAGEYQVTWDARTDVGDDAVAGVYYMRVQIDGSQFTKNMVLVR
jgi:flagellar hook assembly protein FlgD